VTGDSSRHRWVLPLLVFATAVLVTVEFIVVGLLPLLARDLGVSIERAGWLVAVFALSAALLGPPATLLAGRWTPRAVLAGSLFAFGLATVMAALVPAFGVQLAARGVQGALLTLFIGLASAEAAAMAGRARAGRAVGQVNLGVVFATVFIVPLGVALADLFGWQSVFLGLGALAVFGSALLLPVMPPRRASLSAPLRDQAAMLRLGSFLAQLCLSAVVFTAMFSTYSYIAAYFEEVLRLEGREVAVWLLGFGLAGLAGNWLAMRWVDRSPMGLTLVVALALVAALLALGLSGGSRLFALPPLALWGAAHTAAFVACQVRVMAAAPAAPAFAAALNISLCNLGIALGAGLGGWIVARQGIEMLWLGGAAVGAVSLGFGLALWLRSRPPEGTPCRMAR
jgi:MFS transporter, DHA1 family, inner membrane transport protein